VSVIGAKSSNRAFEGSLLRKDELVVDVDGIDKLGADGLADAHGEMVVDLDGERSSRRKSRRLAQGNAGCQKEGQEQGGSALHLVER
jgi:hypothetical protein